MEEADARLQEIVACLLNEHGGNYEPTLRQTFACLHNSGLYEARSPVEVEQREQQVLTVFRSFPFRAGAPVDTGVGSRVEETRTSSAGGYGVVYGSHNSSGGSSTASNSNGAAGVAYVQQHAQSGGASNVGAVGSTNSSVREPEEAGEIVAAEGDPENVGEDPVGSASSSLQPEALPPPYGVENHEQEGPLAPGPELSLQQEPLPTAETMRSNAEDPEGVVDGGFRGGASVAVVGPGSGPPEGNVQEGSLADHAADPGGPEEWDEHSHTRETLGTATWNTGDSSGGYPETGEAEKGEVMASGDAARSVMVSFRGSRGETGVSRSPGEDRNGQVLRTVEADQQGSEASPLVASQGNGDDFAYDGAAEGPACPGRDEEGNGLDGALGSPDGDPESTSSRQVRYQGYRDAVSASGSREAPRSDPWNDRTPSAITAGAAGPARARPAQPPSSWIASTPKDDGAVSVDADKTAVASDSLAVPAPAKGLGVSFAGGSGKPVAEPHLKTSGQPLVHSNRAGAPTGMSTDLTATLKALKLRRRHRFVVMRIDNAEVVAETVGSPSEGAAALRAALPFTDCRYAVFDQEVKMADGRKTDKLFFITWLPHNATAHNKMAYSHGKVAVRRKLEGFYDIAASSFEDVETALGLGQEDSEESDIEF